MAVKIRLARRGRKKLAKFDIVVADERAPRDGKFIEKIGNYDPNREPADINFNEEKAFNWVMKGAQPTDTVRTMLSQRGIMLRKHLQIGVQKGALSQEEADKRFNEWIEEKNAKLSKEKEAIDQKKESERKAKHEAESKVKEERAEALRKKQEAKQKEEAASAGGEKASSETSEAQGQSAGAPQEAQNQGQAEHATEEKTGKQAEEKSETKDQSSEGEGAKEEGADKNAGQEEQK